MDADGLSAPEARIQAGAFRTIASAFGRVASSDPVGDHGNAPLRAARDRVLPRAIALGT